MNAVSIPTDARSQKTPEILVPFLGSIYIALVLLYVMVGTNFAPFSLIFIPFIALFLLGAFGVWRRSRTGYAASSVLSAVFLILEGTQVMGALSAVTILDEFLSAITAVPILFAVLVYSILGLREVWRKTSNATPARLIPASTFVILLILGFILGGITVGVVAADTERRLLSTASGGDIVIVQGAGNQNNGQFYSPPTFTIRVGTTVTWVNHDGTTHTVTSKGSTLFDSGPLPVGGTFSYKFTQAGTYDYYCTIHPWMTGTVVVNSS